MMEDFFSTNLFRIISTIAILILYPIIRYLFNKLLKSYSDVTHLNKTNAMMVKKSLNFILGLLVIIIIITIWGVKPQNIFLTLSSIFAVIGVALFAQWSVLSNITAGFILFFSLHIKIGDQIEIMDKDFPTVAHVEDIKTFHTYLRGKDCKRYVYPNNLLLQKGISIINEKPEELEKCDESKTV